MTIMEFVNQIINKIVSIFKNSDNENVTAPTLMSTLSTINSELTINKNISTNSEYILNKLREISNSIHSTLYCDIMAKVKEAYLHNSKDVIYDIDGDNQITINDITTLTDFWNNLNNPIDLSYYIKSTDSTTLSYMTYTSYIGNEEDINYEECYGFYGRKLNYCSFKSAGKTFPVNYMIPKRTVIGTLKPYVGYELPAKVNLVPGSFCCTVNKKNGNVALAANTPMVQYGLGVNATCTKTSYYM